MGISKEEQPEMVPGKRPGREDAWEVVNRSEGHWDESKPEGSISLKASALPQLRLVRWNFR